MVWGGGDEGVKFGLEIPSSIPQTFAFSHLWEQHLNLQRRHHWLVALNQPAHFAELTLSPLLPLPDLSMGWGGARQESKQHGRSSEIPPTSKSGRDADPGCPFITGTGIFLVPTVQPRDQESEYALQDPGEAACKDAWLIFPPMFSPRQTAVDSMQCPWPPAPSSIPAKPSCSALGAAWLLPSGAGEGHNDAPYWY